MQNRHQTRMIRMQLLSQTVVPPATSFPFDLPVRFTSFVLSFKTSIDLLFEEILAGKLGKWPRIVPNCGKCAMHTWTPDFGSTIQLGHLIYLAPEALDSFYGKPSKGLMLIGWMFHVHCTCQFAKLICAEFGALVLNLPSSGT